MYDFLVKTMRLITVSLDSIAFVMFAMYALLTYTRVYWYKVDVEC